jgi:superfamily II DNA or RNA helicase
MELKPRQIEAYNAVFAALDRGVDRQLVALPTGVGKTVLAAHIAKQFDRVLFLAHRQELIAQTARTMALVDPDRTQGRIEQGSHDLEGQFTIAMLPTVHRRLQKIPPDSFDCVILDEAHHACSKTFREVLDHFRPQLRLGLSATPERLDGLALSNLFSEISYSMTLADAVNENLLVPPSAIQCLTSVNISAVHTRGGDLAEDELAALVDDPARNAFIASKFLEHCPGRRAIAFAVNIAHAVNLTEAFRAVGIKADWISGNDPLRSEKLERFDNGEIQILANCQILTEGYDSPKVDAVLLCRPTKSRSLYCQMLGRGLRLFLGKENCRILDFVDVAGKHSLMSAWKFFGFTKSPKQDQPFEIGDEEKEKKEKEERESRVRAIDLERTINLFLPPEIPDSFSYGSAPWHREPATPKQLAFLESQGYAVDTDDFTKGQASALIAAMPASTGQMTWLNSLGFDVSVNWTRQQATIALDEVKTRMTDALAKIRAKGFTVIAGNRRVIVEPPDRLDLIQRSWIEQHKKPLLFALKAELKEAA